jgi:hypothetical protein
MLSLALLVGGADVANAKAVKVTPTYSITSAVVSGKKVKFTFYVALGTEVQGCSGKVTASHKLSKKKTAKWSASLKQSAVACAATIHGSLPKENFNKKTKFQIKYPGNSKIKPFSATKSLTLSPPPPTTPTPGGPTTPVVLGPQHPGPWTMYDTDSSGYGGFTFTIQSDHLVPAITRASSLSMDCGAGGSATQVPFQWNNSFFSMGGQSGKVTSSGDRPYVTSMAYTITWSFTDAHSGTGHFSALGNFQPDANSSTTYSCSREFDVLFSGGNP